MNKAFVREDNNDQDEPEVQPQRREGVNYITAQGLQQLQQELRTLQSQERPKVVDVVAWAAANGDRSENADYQYGKRRLREIDRRIRFLLKRLDQAQVVPPAQGARREQIFFGATVEVIEEEGEALPRSFRYTIVGEDESDAASGRISWTAPLARALLGRRVGDQVSFMTPAGERFVEIQTIEYTEQP